MPATTLTPVDINTVGEAFMQSNKDTMYAAIPRVLAQGEFSGRGATTYELPELDNFMIGTDLHSFRPGVSNAQERELKSTTITVAPKGLETDHVYRPLNRPYAHAFADLERNLAPQLLNYYHQGIEKLIFDAIKDNYNATNFTASSGKSLDDSDDHGNQNVINDLAAQFDALRQYRGVGYSLELWVDQRVLSVFARHPSLTGHGALATFGTPSNTAFNGFASGTPAGLAPSAAVAVLKSLLEIDEVRVWRLSGSSARRGQTANIQEIAHGLCFGGIFDRRQGVFDIRSETSFDSPDGCLVLGEEREPYVHNWADEKVEMEGFAGRGSHACFVPRSEFGFRMKETGALGALSS